MTGFDRPFPFSFLPHDGKPIKDFSFLRPCDVLIEPAHDLFGLATRLFKEPAQHALMVDMDTSRAWEAVGNGVKLNAISRHKPYQVYRILNMTDEARYPILEQAWEDRDKPYGYHDLLARAVSILLGKPVHFGVDCDEADEAPLRCSGYVSRWFAQGGFDLCPGLLDHEVDPDDLAASKLLYRVY